MAPRPKKYHQAPTPLDTRTYLQRTRAGDKPARHDLILYWLDLAYAYVGGELGPGIDEDDLRTLLYESVFEALDKADPRASTDYLDGFLRLTVWGHLSQYRRVKARRDEIDKEIQPPAPEPTRLAPAPAPRTAPDPKPAFRVLPADSWPSKTTVDPAEMQEEVHIQLLLEKLPEEERTILALHVMDDVPLTQCQVVLGLSVHRCRELMKNALESLRVLTMEAEGSSK